MSWARAEVGKQAMSETGTASLVADYFLIQMYLFLAMVKSEFTFSWAMSDLIQGSIVSAKVIVPGERGILHLERGSQYIV